MDIAHGMWISQDLKVAGQCDAVTKGGQRCMTQLLVYSSDSVDDTDRDNRHKMLE